RQLFGSKKGIFKAVSPKLIIFVPYCIKACSVCQDQVGAKLSFMHSFIPPTSKTALPFSRHWDRGAGAQSFKMHPVLYRRHKKRLCRFWSLGSKASSRYTSPEKSFGIVCEFSPFRLDKGVKMG
ncbi:MAG: hypothetical protein IKT91_04250, partial [Clostridia bacterium]|nr:hypothetical protein [Clostridia bacterium]